MTFPFFPPSIIFSGQTISWGSSQESWANTCTSAPERAATCHRCLGSGARTSLVIQHLGLPAVNLQSQALTGRYAKPSCGLLLPDWACHRQIKEAVVPFWKHPSTSKEFCLFVVVPTGFMVTHDASSVTQGYPAGISINPFFWPIFSLSPPP